MICNVGWKVMTALMVIELVVSLFSTLAWGLGLVSTLIDRTIDQDTCTEQCIIVARRTVAEIQPFAYGLYAVTALTADLAILGLLSGQLWLQVPNVAVSFLRLVGSLVIAEYLIKVNMGPNVFIYNRVIMYSCFVINFIVFISSFFQAIQEARRKLRERHGHVDPEIRPLTRVMGRIFGTSGTCCPCTPPTIAEGVLPEGVLPEAPVQVAEAAHLSDDVDRPDNVQELKQPYNTVKVDDDNEGELSEVGSDRSGSSLPVEKEESRSLNMDDDFLLNVEGEDYLAGNKEEK